MLLVERRTCIVITKYHVRMYFGVQVVDASMISRNHVFEGRLSLLVAAFATAAVVVWTALSAVTVDVRVGLAVDVDSAAFGVLTVCEGCDGSQDREVVEKRGY